MNRRQRRELERKGQIPKAEPVYNMKPKAMVDAVLNGSGKDIMMAEIHKSIVQKEKDLALDVDTCVLWTLHNNYGWGKQRLRKFYMDLFEEHLRMRQFYDIDEPYPERMKLKEKGVDVEAWYNELFDDEGNYRSTLGGKK